METRRCSDTQSRASRRELACTFSLSGRPHRCHLVSVTSSPDDLHLQLHLQPEAWPDPAGTEVGGRGLLSRNRTKLMGVLLVFSNGIMKYSDFFYTLSLFH